MRRRVCFAAILIVGCIGGRYGAGYPVQQSLGLAHLEKEADLICKVEAGPSKPAESSAYKSTPGFQVLSTTLNVVEVYKGNGVGKQIVFEHYALKKDDAGYFYMPQNYQLEPGKLYILFAKKTDRDGVYQQLWENHRSKDDQGLVRAADKTKRGKQPIKDVLWAELTKLLASDKPEDVLYAIKQLDEMSGGGYDRLTDFDRTKTLSVIEPFIRHSNIEIAKGAIAAIGSRNPFMSPGYAAGWLATIGKGSIPGYSAWDAPAPSARQFWKPLADVADSDRSPEVRALAIRALGRTQVPHLHDRLNHWLTDPAPAVRQSAAILLADFPDLANDKTIERLAEDKDASVRAGVAQAIGFGQWSDRVKQLSVLINDVDPSVAEAAAMSLLSLPTKDTRPALEALVEHSEYRPLIVNALAADNPRPYLDGLADIVRHDRRPKHWWGGSIPWGVSWDILFKFVRSNSGEMHDGKLDEVLDALESPDYFSSSEPRDLYALYVQQHMTKRAAAFRQACRKRITYDIDYYFKMVDESPNTYRRE